MSESAQTSSWKCCATCEHWSGLWRQGLPMSNNKIEGDCKGRCHRNAGAKLKGTKAGNDVCAHWSQWQVLVFTAKSNAGLPRIMRKSL